jgi:AcrR family transcriptional regulator
MGRWQPGTREKLHAAAQRLFLENGYEQTTAADIAAAVGVTERTFFRHFTDKREVLFDAQPQLVELLTRGVREAPLGGPLELAAGGLRAAASFFEEERRAPSRVRQRLVDATPALDERERLKLAELAGAVHGALRDRGIGEPAATLAAESAITVFKAAITQWLADGETRSFDELATELLDSLRALSAG